MLTKREQKQSKSIQDLSFEVFKKRDLRLAHFSTWHKIDLYNKSLLYGSAAFLPAIKTMTLYLLTTRSPNTFFRFSGGVIKLNFTHEYRVSS